MRATSASLTIFSLSCVSGSSARAFPSSGRRFISCSSIRNGSAPGSCGPTGCVRPNLRELITMSGSDPNTSIVPPTKSTTMRAKGLTDYVAWPLYHTLGTRHFVTFATDRAGGFDAAHIAGLLKLLPVLALVSEIRIKNRLARTLLETYVGSHASELVLAGATRRGSGTTVSAAIMICDLRDFTRISDNWPRDYVIDLLNGYFDAMSEPIARHGGEILKFIGDGLLAIFPLSQPSACANLLHAVTDARQAMVALNEKNGETGRAPLNYGIGVHVGDVMYGNIGSRTRLDFTVIGPAVNMASRLETLTKQLGRTVLLSRAFADFVESDFDLERVGEYPVRGFNAPIELFAYHG